MGETPCINPGTDEGDAVGSDVLPASVVVVVVRGAPEAGAYIMVDICPGNVPNMPAYELEGR